MKYFCYNSFERGLFFCLQFDNFVKFIYLYYKFIVQINLFNLVYFEIDLYVDLLEVMIIKSMYFKDKVNISKYKLI